jgi:multicomponent Na+:H+ antiporter subunit B
MIDILLLAMLVICALGAIHTKVLLSSGAILSAYSLLMAVVWTRLNAVDVAFTEASVGAGITTVLLIAAISRTVRGEAFFSRTRRTIPGLILIILTGGVLVYGTFDMPAYEDPAAPARHHVADYYMEKTEEETGMENMVTALLANYRGYDTLGETSVIFTAGMSVILLLRRKPKKKAE